MKDYKFKINGRKYNVSLKEGDDNTLNIRVDGIDYLVEPEDVEVERKPVVRPKVIMQAEAPIPRGTDTNVGASISGGQGSFIKTPLPGVVLDIFVKEGDSIKAGQKIICLESMKMENNIEADKNGVVKVIKVKKGDSVQEGDVLILIS